MDDLIAFLNARLDELEAAAKAAASPSLHDLSWTAVDDHPPGNVVVLSSVIVDSSGDLVAKAQPERSYDSAVGRHIALNNPAAVIADIAAKRQIISLQAGTQDLARSMRGTGKDTMTLGRAQALRVALRYLATAYASHPDYRSEWAP